MYYLSTSRVLSDTKWPMQPADEITHSPFGSMAIILATNICFILFIVFVNVILRCCCRSQTPEICCIFDGFGNYY